MERTMVNSQQVLSQRAVALTDRGRKRTLNEDAVFQRTAPDGRMGLYMVCDGLGGFQAGEVASRLAVETVAAEMEVIFGLAHHPQAAYFDPEHLIEAAVKAANRAIRDYAEAHADDIFSLGTTLTLVLIYGQTAYIANIGDGRAYSWRAGQMTQITRDHSLVAQLVRRGLLDEAEMLEHPHSNILSRAVGVENQVQADLFQWALQPGDRLLLCSDGLWKAFPELDRLARLFALSLPAVELADLLIAEAKWRDGSDNISAVVVDIEGTDPTADLSTRPLADCVPLAS